MIPKTIIHLMSGGLDSTVCLRMLLDEGNNIHCLLVNYRQQHAKELWFAEQTCKRWNVKFTVIDLPKLGGLTQENWIIPNRNAILLSLAVNLAMQSKSDTVTIGCNKDDEAMFPDCRMAFIQTFNNLLMMAEIHIEVCAPFLDWPKSKIARLASDMGVTKQDIWTCYLGGEKPCGECPACKKMETAFT